MAIDATTGEERAFTRRLADKVKGMGDQKTEDFIVTWSRDNLSASSLQKSLREMGKDQDPK
jgi:hypothetical protein